MGCEKAYKTWRMKVRILCCNRLYEADGYPFPVLVQLLWNVICEHSYLLQYLLIGVHAGETMILEAVLTVLSWKLEMTMVEMV